ncbi:MAG: hypothetical protein K1V84_11900 [Muribaculaceae bacterium]
MKLKIFFLLLAMISAGNLFAQLPNGYKANYTYVRKCDNRGVTIEDYTTKPDVLLYIMNTNWGFGCQSTAIFTQLSVAQGYDVYGGMVNGWHFYTQDLSLSGLKGGSLYISKDRRTIRHSPWSDGEYSEYRIKD